MGKLDNKVTVVFLASDESRCVTGMQLRVEPVGQDGPVPGLISVSA
jgi:hypothetical protein